MIHVVWLKKDLRFEDHIALGKAASSGKILVMYCLEPGFLSCSDTSGLHVWWILESIKLLKIKINKLGGNLYFFNRPIIDVLKTLRTKTDFTLYSHQETGNSWSFNRDKQVKTWCRQNNINWYEYPQNGVIRALKDRNNWSKLRDHFFEQPLQKIPNIIPWADVDIDDDEVPLAISYLPSYCKPDLFPGDSKGIDTLESFANHRGKNYLKSISSPSKAIHSSSRLSPYITFGNLSLRSIWNQTDKSYLSAFRSRLYWHCHFIQKLESQPSIEFIDFHPIFEDMRNNFYNESFINAWILGRTGYPFVDACIRSLRTLGWLNFRMRAMVTSFATYHLLQDWKNIAHPLAKLFIDYEPGIHYSQLQMQSGTTAINAIRIYDPIKQGFDHDPRGLFIKKWVSELAHVPEFFIHEPWRMKFIEQQSCYCIIGKDYPAPIVENKLAMKNARTLLAEYRNKPEFKQFLSTVIQKHASRKNLSKRKKTKIPTKQLSLFD